MADVGQGSHGAPAVGSVEIAAGVTPGHPTSHLQTLKPYEYDPGLLGAEEVEIAVESCGICHSDLSIINNEWGISTYPVVPGHEVIGRVVAMGPQARGVTIGQPVGVGWGTASCMHCHQCLSGDQNLCAQNVPTIVGHKGGFADRLRVHPPILVTTMQALAAPRWI